VTRRLDYTETALDDLADIAASIAVAAGDREIGSDFAGQIRAKCRSFALLPGVLGTPRPELAGGLRSFPFKDYVILFRYAEGMIEVINVLSGRRDIAGYFADDPNAGD
jgi:toxin ParE1/3/4